VGYPISLTVSIEGRASLSVWQFGDGALAINQPYTSHTWTTPGDYRVILSAYNESLPGGIKAGLTIHVVTPPVYYVAADSLNPKSPFTSWATAAAKIQDAIDAALAGSTVLVSNGVYAGGVALSKPLLLLSVNGPQATIIDGGGATGCISMIDGVSLSGFTLTNGWAQNGGGLWCASTNAYVSNCVIVGNSAAQSGGGARGATLYNCTLSGNSATYGGAAAAYYSTLENCLLTDNSGGALAYCFGFNCTLAHNSGGVLLVPAAVQCVLYNSILYFNNGGDEPNYAACMLNYCCTTPLPDGLGNITNAPLFVDFSAGNLRLQPDSPCINAGNNAYVTTAVDLDGKPRIAGGQVDIGAYEFHNLAPLRFSGQPKLTTNGWLLNLTGEPNKWTRIQKSSNLKDWSDVWAGFMEVSGTHQLNDRDTEHKAMFYRAVTR
jgi:hypothetical protein